MNEGNRIDCKWIELFFNRYNRIEKCICHLNPESRLVDVNGECVCCPHYEKREEEESEHSCQE